MGNVIIAFRILPGEPKEFFRIKNEVSKLKPERLEEDPIGFGLSALRATFIIPDAGNVQDELENRLRKIKGINELEVLAVSRSL